MCIVLLRPNIVHNNTININKKNQLLWSDTKYYNDAPAIQAVLHAMWALASVRSRECFLSPKFCLWAYPPRYKWATFNAIIVLNKTQRCSSVNRFVTFSGDNLINFVTEQNDISIVRSEITEKFLPIDGPPGKLCM